MQAPEAVIDSMGRSEQRTDFWGDEYTVHFDDDGNEIGRSEEETDFFGDKYTQHYDKDHNEVGHSEERTDFFGDAYTQHYDADASKAGHSEDRTDFFNDPYTQHYDRDGDKAGHSEPREDFWGDRYTSHFDASGDSTSHRPTTPHGKHKTTTDRDAPSSSGFESESSYDGSSSSTTTSSSAGSSSALGWLIVVVAVAIVFAFFAFIASSDKSDMVAQSTPSRRANVNVEAAAPPNELVNRNEFEQNGERWRAKRDVDVYQDPPDSFGTPLSTLRKAAVVPKGTWVVTLRSIVLAKRSEGRLGKGAEYGVIAVQNNQMLVATGPPLIEGQPVPIYFNLGEGCWSAWMGGRLVPVCNIEYDGPRQEDLWAQVKLPDDSLGWVRYGYDGFGFENQAEMNNTLGNTIADNGLALVEKLEKIDLLIKDGADLNGDAGQHGLTPIEAAVRSRDVPLISALKAKGLNLQNAETANGFDPSSQLLSHGIGIASYQRCPAFAASQVALEEGGAEMLEFLLDNGLQLGCLREPSLHAFLRFGIAADKYPVERAIAVADLLSRHGARVTEVDAQWKSIFDVLDQAKSQETIAPLRDALTRLKAMQESSEWER